MTMSITCFLATHSSADDWDNYRSHMSGYYFLDDQPFSEVVCNVSISTLDPVYWRAQLQPILKNIEVDESLSSFKLTYKKGGGISILEPHFLVRLKTVEGLSDPAKIQNGLDGINRGAAMQISGARQIIEAIFDEFIQPKREDFTGLRIATSEGSTTIEYIKPSEEVRQVYSNGARRSSVRVTGSPMTIESSEEFTVVAGKQALSKLQGTIKQGDMNTNFVMTIQYQQIGSAVFPSALEQQIHMENPMIKQDMSTAIRLNQCISK